MADEAASPASFQPSNAATRIGWSTCGGACHSSSVTAPRYRRDPTTRGDAVTPYADHMVVVSELHEVTPEVVEAFTRLIPQLSTSAPTVTADDLAEMVASCDASPDRRDDDGTIVGCITLVVFRIPTGVRAWIEDVVVDEAVRGTGAGAALNRARARPGTGSGPARST